ncbi:MAG TPA: avidin/streptavidin family protein [Chitinophaga sp.]|uniref:avidin/streptavidin family protein n=1 Tax=Chitinophaga sp. TaxID=1869181 RepID=UPI002DBA66A5|nr:avidin/streptavidin family protein [Chitinophaga sp.]HEU4554753.1 avidin/streptavidin family protein [Chitinophaga sp.]
MESKNNTSWTGTWKNQYGSVLTIEAEEAGRIKGTFQSAVDPGVKEGIVTGICSNDLIAFAAMGEGGRKVASWTGILRNGRIETLWHVAVNEKLVAGAEGVPATKKTAGIWEAFVTGADTFERV